MNNLFPVLVPLVNTNEVDSLLASLAVKEGQPVKKGDLLAVFETTKSTFELTAEQGGYVLGLRFSVGDTLQTGERLCYLADAADTALPVEPDEVKPAGEEMSAPEGLRITQPALALAQEMGVDLAQLPHEMMITEKVIREMFSVEKTKLDPKALVIYGGGGHAKSLIELIEAEGKYHVAGILDDHLPVGSQILGVPVLGGGDFLMRLKSQRIGLCVNAVGGIGDISPRLKIYEKIKTAGISVPTVIHPRACVEKSAPWQKVSRCFSILMWAVMSRSASVAFSIPAVSFLMTVSWGNM
jgi:hypothetical protein